MRGTRDLGGSGNGHMSHLIQVGANRAPVLIGGGMLGVVVVGLATAALDQSFGLTLQASAAAAGVIFARIFG